MQRWWPSQSEYVSLPHRLRCLCGTLTPTFRMSAYRAGPIRPSVELVRNICRANGAGKSHMPGYRTLPWYTHLGENQARGIARAPPAVGLLKYDIACSLMRGRLTKGITYHRRCTAFVHVRLAGAARTT
jgi:hypothetical protein